jgi:hypothetical protein
MVGVDGRLRWCSFDVDGGEEVPQLDLGSRLPERRRLDLTGLGRLGKGVIAVAASRVGWKAAQTGDVGVGRRRASSVGRSWLAHVGLR